MLRTASATLDSHEECIGWQHLPDDVVEELTALAPQLTPSTAGGLLQNLEELSRVAIRQAPESNCGNISQAARRLGISRRALYRKLNN